MAHITGQKKPKDADYRNAAATITRLVLGGVVPEIAQAKQPLMFAT